LQFIILTPMESKLNTTDTDLINACAELLAIEQHFLPMLSSDSMRCSVGELVERMSELQAPHVEKICAKSASTWGELLAKARVALPRGIDPSNAKVPAEERLLATLLRDIERLAGEREAEHLR
jgi:hypothetical protein